MSTDPAFFDPDSLEHLSPDMQRMVLATQVKYAEAVAQLAPRHAVALTNVHEAWSRVHAATRLAQTAQADHVVFEESIGAQSIGGSRLKEGLVGVTLASTAAAEAYFALPGVRLATGELGEVSAPWDDPLSLTAAVVVGALSITVAHMAGTSFSMSERSIMREPEPAELSARLSTPQGVRADPANATLLEDSPLADVVEVPVVEDPFAPDPVSPVPALPPSAEVLDEENRRHVNVLHGGRSGELHRKLGIALVSFGIGLWTINGLLRADYIDRLPDPAAPATSGMLAAAVPSSGSRGLGAWLTTPSIVALSILLFLLSVLVVFAAHTPAMLRGRELTRRKRSFEKDLKKTVKDAEQAIAEFEETRSAIAVQKLEGHAVSETARLPREDW